MHLLRLATFPDTLVSILCDLTDGPRRERDLNHLWDSYKERCDGQGRGVRSSCGYQTNISKPKMCLTCTENIPSSRSHGQGYEEAVYDCNVEAILKRLCGGEPKADERDRLPLCDVLASPTDGTDAG